MFILEVSSSRHVSKTAWQLFQDQGINFPHSCYKLNLNAWENWHGLDFLFATNTALICLNLMTAWNGYCKLPFFFLAPAHPILRTLKAFSEAGDKASFVTHTHTHTQVGCLEIIPKILLRLVSITASTAFCCSPAKQTPLTP